MRKTLKTDAGGEKFFERLEEDLDRLHVQSDGSVLYGSPSGLG